MAEKTLLSSGCGTKETMHSRKGVSHNPCGARQREERKEREREREEEKGKKERKRKREKERKKNEEGKRNKKHAVFFIMRAVGIIRNGSFSSQGIELTAQRAPE